MRPGGQRWHPPLPGLLLWLALLQACSGTPATDDAAAPHFVSRQQAAARAAVAKGDLAQARRLLQATVPLQGKGEDLRALEAEIDAAHRQALAAAANAAARGDSAVQAQELRRALALKPDDTDTRQVLQKMFRTSALAALDKKRQRELGRERINPEAVAAVSSTTAGTQRASPTPVVANIVRKGDGPEDELAHLEQALSQSPVPDSRQLQRASALRKQLGQQWYEQGVLRMPTDLPGAIAALEKSVSYDPDNAAAQLKLKQARTLHRNLQRIGSGANSN